MRAHTHSHSTAFFWEQRAIKQQRQQQKCSLTNSRSLIPNYDTHGSQHAKAILPAVYVCMRRCLCSPLKCIPKIDRWKSICPLALSCNGGMKCWNAERKFIHCVKSAIYWALIKSGQHSLWSKVRQNITALGRTVSICVCVCCEIRLGLDN